MLVVENLTKNIDNIPVLDGASLTIEDGSIYGLVGKNGAGKTTIIRHLAGVLRQDSGSIRYDDEDIWENAELRQRIGLIPDEIYFPPGYSLRNMRKMYSRIYHNWNPERYQELLERFGLPEKKNLRTFSKGQKKQAAFCLVMSIMPDYLLLDEPLDGLDPIMRKTIW